MKKEKKVTINKWLVAYNSNLDLPFPLVFKNIIKVLRDRTVEEIQDDIDFIKS